jgi:hypothetical protein
MSASNTVRLQVPRQIYAPGDLLAIQAEVSAAAIDDPATVPVHVRTLQMEVPLVVTREHVGCRLSNDGWPHAWPIRSGDGAYVMRDLPELTLLQAEAVASLRAALERYRDAFPSGEWWGNEGAVARAHLLLQDVAYGRQR